MYTNLIKICKIILNDILKILNTNNQTFLAEVLSPWFLTHFSFYEIVAKLPVAEEIKWF